MNRTLYGYSAVLYFILDNNKNHHHSFYCPSCVVYAINTNNKDKLGAFQVRCFPGH